MRPYPFAKYRAGAAFLDTFTSVSNILCAHHLHRKVISTWGGQCINVTRSSDNTTTDIGFIGNTLDVASLLAFCGAGDGTLNKFYDQTGHGNHCIASVAGVANQYKIVSAGVYLDYMDQDGSAKHYVVTLGSTYTGTYLVHVSHESIPGASGAPQVLVTDPTYFTAGDGFTNYYYVAQAHFMANISDASTASSSSIDEAGYTLGSIVPVTIRYDRTQTTAVTQMAGRVGGIPQAVGPFNSQVVTPNFATASIEYANTTFPSIMKLRGRAFFTTNIDPIVASLEAVMTG